MDLKQMGPKRVDCCNLVNDKNQWLAIVNVIIKTSDSIKYEKFDELRSY